MNDPEGFDETTYYRYIRTLDGRLEPIDLIKQNGRAVPHFARPDRDDYGTRKLAELLQFYREIMYRLNRLERRTWLPLLLGWTIEDLARSEGVSRAAIYERIRGSSQGHGGMIRKNDYVAIWWRTRRKPKP